MKKFLQKVLDLRATSDFEKARSTIGEGVSLRGYNLWILLCAALLASLGLDTNSTAVIIGAMLISPLMSPILGVGISVAIHEKALLIRSLKNLGMAVGISLFASVLYFTLTPLGEVTPELQARTFPTLLDVLVALFGGIAGIVSISRRDQTNAIPGVAIATALMPPLCTAGFGIAVGNWNYFLGAFYLFFINAVFISLTTYLVAKYLHFPKRQFVNRELERKYSRWFTVISVVVLMPSIYFLYTVYKKEVIKKDINSLVITPIKNHGNEILKWDVDDRDSVLWIKVYHSGTPLSDSLKTSIDSSLTLNGMRHYRLRPMRVNLTKEEVSQLSAEMTRQMFQEMHLEEIKQESNVKEIRMDSLPMNQLFSEVKIIFPFVDTISNGWLMVHDTSSATKTLPVVFYSSKRSLSNAQFKQFYSFLVVRLSKDTIVLMKGLER
ncbi:MAG TPA: TIGR00341 family protein [Segetibacter sp.]|nr:TIGR00341 family protein [Segetibacter sp.]